MSLEKKIAEDMKAAMKAKDKDALRGISGSQSCSSAQQNRWNRRRNDGRKRIKLLQKLIKQRKDSLDIYLKQNREDLAAIEQAEIAVIEKYLPEQMGVEELKGIINSIIEQTGANSMKDMGKVMGMASKQLAGKADGKTISGIVKELLSKAG